MASAETAAGDKQWCSPCQFSFVAIESGELIAQVDDATRTLTISFGMLNYVKNEDELAFVIYHEVFHILFGAQVPAQQRELAADLFAVKLMAGTEFDAWRGAEILRRMALQFADVSLGHYPSFTQRIDATESLIQELAK